MTKFSHLSWSFLVGFYTVTKSGHLSWSFLVISLKFINFGHLSLEKTMVTKIFGFLVTNLSFSTSDVLFDQVVFVFGLNPSDVCNFLFLKVEIAFYIAPRELQLAQVCQAHKRPFFTNMMALKNMNK